MRSKNQKLLIFQFWSEIGDVPSECYWNDSQKEINTVFY